jgi:uncharacterized protein YggT (Ycf19 family)
MTRAYRNRRSEATADAVARDGHLGRLVARVQVRRKPVPARYLVPAHPGEEGLTVNLLLSLVQTALTIFILVILARFLLSWVQLRPGTAAYRLNRLLCGVTEPYLRLFRPLAPPVRLGNVALDLSAALGLAVLIVASMILGAL